MKNAPSRAATSSGASPDVNMSIRRFVAENSRTALRQVRDTLGGDAVILANRSIEGGVEVLAAAPEAVDALTRRIAAPTPDASALAAQALRATMPVTPTELGLKPATRNEAARPVGRKGLASLFQRRSSTQAAPVAPTPVPDAAAASAAASYLSFADELAAIAGDDDVVMHVAPQAAPREMPADVVPPKPAAAPAAPESVAPAPQSVVLAPQPTASAPVISAEELSDVVAREVSREIGREFGRDVINDLTQDVTREVSQAVTDEVTRGVTSAVTRDVSREVTRDVTREVMREMHAMQATLTEQLSTLTWTDAMRRQPAKTKLMQDLVLAGFSPALARHIHSRLPDDCAGDSATTWAANILARNLPVATDADDLVAEGGVFALVGPTGVGKTTTVAKLAARFALKHGVDKLALITTDGFRIGAQDQLRIYGKILGIQVRSIHDEPSLTSAIDHLSDKKLVLIDTAGLGQRDERVAEQIAMLRGAQAKRLVVLNATCDAETLDHVVATFADRDFAGCVITKTDEAMRLGPVLDAVIRHRLRIHHVSTGQKVPEDLERPEATALVARALEPRHPASAFAVDADDAPAWMAAMNTRAVPLDASLLSAVPSPGSLHA